MKDIKFIIIVYEYAGLETPSRIMIKNIKNRNCESAKNINEVLKFDTVDQAIEFIVKHLPMTKELSFSIGILYDDVVFCPDSDFNKVIY